jgi:uncharacterized membrane protein YhaH (DUF805 family)
MCHIDRGDTKFTEQAVEFAAQPMTPSSSKIPPDSDRTRFRASGRITGINTGARSLLCVAGLFVMVILSPRRFNVVTIVTVLIPWLMCGFAIHIERLHDSEKRAWWQLQGLFGQLAKTDPFAAAARAAMHYASVLSGFALLASGFIEIRCLRHLRLQQVCFKAASAGHAREPLKLSDITPD